MMLLYIMLRYSLLFESSLGKLGNIKVLTKYHFKNSNMRLYIKVEVNKYVEIILNKYLKFKSFFYFCNLTLILVCIDFTLFEYFQ